MISVIVCVILVLLVAICAIPAEVRALMIGNCRGNDGWLNPVYVVREFFALVNFFAGIFFFAIVLGTLVVCVAQLVNHYLVPFDHINSAAAQIELSPSKTKQNLNSDPDNVRKAHTLWYVMKGGSVEGAETLQRSLWSAIPFVVLTVFIAVVWCLRLTSKNYVAAIDELIRDEVKRMSGRLAKTYEK